jgi:acyl-CoA thioesterase I
MGPCPANRTGATISGHVSTGQRPAKPRPTVVAAFGAGLSDHPMYAKLADELALPLHADGWARVLGDEKFKSDQIHANAAGYREFAQGLVATLRATGLLR